MHLTSVLVTCFTRPKLQISCKEAEEGDADNEACRRLVASKPERPPLTALT